MAVKTIMHGQEGQAHQGPSGGRLAPEAIERIEQRRSSGAGVAARGDGGDGDEPHAGPAGAPPAPEGGQPAEPTQQGAQPGRSPQPSPQGGQSTQQGSPPDPSPSEAGPDPAPPAPPAPPGPQGDESRLQAQIELERATQQLRTANDEANRLRQQVEQMQQQEQQRRQSASDPRRLLMSHGHDPLQAIETILGEDSGGSGGQQGGQGSLGRDSREGGSEQILSQFKQLLDERLGPLEQSLQGDRAAREHAAAVEDLRATVAAAGDHMSAVATLDLYEGAQDHLSDLEQRNGRPLTQTERMRELYNFERATRDTAKRQIEKLAKAPWSLEAMLGAIDHGAVLDRVQWDSDTVLQALAQNPTMVQAIRKALDSAAGARPAPDPVSAPPTPGHPDQQPPAANPQGSVNPAVLNLQERSNLDLKRAGREAAERLLSNQRRGLG